MSYSLSRPNYPDRLGSLIDNFGDPTKSYEYKDAAIKNILAQHGEMDHIGHIVRLLEIHSLFELYHIGTMEACKFFIMNGCKLSLDNVSAIVKYISCPSTNWDKFNR